MICSVVDATVSYIYTGKLKLEWNLALWMYDGVLPIKDMVFSIPEKAVRLLIITDFIYLQII